MSIAKTLVALLAAVLAAVLPGLTGQPLDLLGWVNVAILVLGAFQVFNGANIPGWAYAKAVAAAATAGLVVVVSALGDGAFTGAEWIQVASAVVGALLVLAVPNSASAHHVA